jgi:hypothetical protein
MQEHNLACMKYRRGRGFIVENVCVCVTEKEIYSLSERVAGTLARKKQVIPWDCLILP